VLGVTSTPPRLADVRAALAAQIEARTTLRATATVPGQINPPVAVVRPARGELAVYKVTFDGAVDYSLAVVILVSYASIDTAQDLLDGFLSAGHGTAVADAIEADPSLGGLVADAWPRAADGYGMISWAGVDYLGTTVIVEVMAN
jgi:hypothetical protein